MQDYIQTNDRLKSLIKNLEDFLMAYNDESTKPDKLAKLRLAHFTAQAD